MDSETFSRDKLESVCAGSCISDCVYVHNFEVFSMISHFYVHNFSEDLHIFLLILETLL